MRSIIPFIVATAPVAYRLDLPAARSTPEICRDGGIGAMAPRLRAIKFMFLICSCSSLS
jgi:hypothetical protein